MAKSSTQLSNGHGSKPSQHQPTENKNNHGNLSKIAMTIFVISWLMLAWLGTMPVTELRTTLSQIGTVIYFAFFLLMPFYTSIEKSRPVPERL